MFNPGEMTERVRIEQKGTSSDGPFRTSTGWSTVATVWAKVAPVSAREDINNEAQRILGKYKVTIRRRTDLTGDMRLVWTSNGDLALNIRELQNVSGRGQYMDIFVTSGGAD